MATINDMNDNLTFNFFFLSKRGSDVVCFTVTAFSLFFGRHDNAYCFFINCRSPVRPVRSRSGPEMSVGAKGHYLVQVKALEQQRLRELFIQK
jgi:hypothetical protein